MNLLAQLDDLYHESKRNRWLRYFAVFCRVALALGFIPSGIVKVMGERFTALPSNHPLGHYFDALQLTGFYYTFIGREPADGGAPVAHSKDDVSGSDSLFADYLEHRLIVRKRPKHAAAADCCYANQPSVRVDSARHWME
jgi:hypothetical protein